MLSFLEKVLKVNIKLHASAEEVAKGDIFLFNHFARFETFIPPYLIYKTTGTMSHSVASPDFFHGNDAASKLLRGLGAVPSNYVRLMPFLASEIIEGRKVIVFPEGGMVKDRRVVDRKGRFGIYSRSARERRKHHTGAAVLAQGLMVFKEAVLKAERKGDDKLLNLLAKDFGPNGREKLRKFAERTLSVLPANITFYPIRVDPNLLENWAELIGGHALSDRFREELRVEGNILLKDTDMDIRLGPPSTPGDDWTALDRLALDFLLDRVKSLDDAYDLVRSGSGGALGELAAKRAQHIIYRMRDRYMRDIYASVSVNLSQLASALIYTLMEQGIREIPVTEFNRSLYLAVKKLQPHTEIALHRSLVDPDYYQGVEEGESSWLSGFMETAARLQLILVEEGRYRFLDKLAAELEFDHIRVENPVAVYANEVRPLHTVTEMLAEALKEERKLGAGKLSTLRFDDELVSYRFDRFRFTKQKHQEINGLQSISADTRPYLLKPENPRPVGVVLVHGFSSSPGEVRPLAELLSAKGFAVMGVRLKGHGTSPWDLKERKREEWLRSVERGRAIMAGITERVALVGFSMGGLLALCSAAENPQGVAGVVTACAPMKLRDKGLVFIELVHHVNKMVGLVSHDKGLKPFHLSTPENPELNYRHVPFAAIHQLDHLIGDTQKLLPKVECPLFILQGDEDPTVVPESASIIYQGVSTEQKTLRLIGADRHGIIYRNIGGANELVCDFLLGL